MPGALVTATQGDERFTTISDANGIYSFPNLTDGVWTISVQMPFFVRSEQDVIVGPGAQPVHWELKMLPIAEALAQTKVSNPGPRAEASAASVQQAPTGATSPQPSTHMALEPEPTPGDSSDEGLLVNGSVNNAATSPFSLKQAFGNTRTNSHSLYNGGIGIIFGSSALDARPYSLTGLNTPQPSYSQTIATASLIGPLNIPHLLPRGPNFGLTYQGTRSDSALVESGLVPTLQQRADTVASINPVAQALLALYPLPDVAGNSSYNYQVPVLNGTHSDAIDAHLGRFIGGTNLSGELGLLDSRANQTSLFGFRDTTDSLGLEAKIQADRRLVHNLRMHLNYNYSRLRTQVTPYFENRINISGDAGMTGNNQSRRTGVRPRWSFPAALLLSPMPTAPSTATRPAA